MKQLKIQITSTALVILLMLAGLAIAFLLHPAMVFAGPSGIPNLNTWVTDGQVATIVPSGNIIYIGGCFSFVGPSTGHGVPLSRATGNPVPLYPKVDGNVNAVASDGSGGWYIGGNFTKVGNGARIQKVRKLFIHHPRHAYHG